MKNIKLLLQGENKTFTTPFVSGLVWRKFIEIRARVDLSLLTPDEVDEMADLVVMAFGDQFTRNDFYEGIPHDRVILTIDELFLPTESVKGEGNGKK